MRVYPELIRRRQLLERVDDLAGRRERDDLGFVPHAGVGALLDKSHVIVHWQEHHDALSVEHDLQHDFFIVAADDGTGFFRSITGYLHAQQSHNRACIG